MMIEVKHDGKRDKWEIRQKEPTGLWKEGKIAVVYEAIMVEGKTPGRKKQYPVKNNKKGVPCMSIQTFTELFIRTEYADSYTWICDETIPNEEKSRLYVAVD